MTSHLTQAPQPPCRGAFFWPCGGFDWNAFPGLRCAPSCHRTDKYLSAGTLALGYFRSSLWEEMQRLTGRAQEKESTKSTKCVHAIALELKPHAPSWILRIGWGPCFLPPIMPVLRLPFPSFCSGSGRSGWRRFCLANLRLGTLERFHISRALSGILRGGIFSRKMPLESGGGFGVQQLWNRYRLDS